MILIYWILNWKPSGFCLKTFSQNRCVSALTRHANSSFDFLLAFSDFLIFILCVILFCLHVCMVTMNFLDVCGVKKRVSSSLELEFE